MGRKRLIFNAGYMKGVGQEHEESKTLPKYIPYRFRWHLFKLVEKRLRSFGKTIEPIQDDEWDVNSPAPVFDAVRIEVELLWNSLITIFGKPSGFPFLSREANVVVGLKPRKEKGVKDAKKTDIDRAIRVEQDYVLKIVKQISDEKISQKKVEAVRMMVLQEFVDKPNVFVGKLRALTGRVADSGRALKVLEERLEEQIKVFLSK